VSRGSRGEPKRIPLWKLEKMAGNPPPPEDWHNPTPPPPGWDANQVRTYSSFQDPRAWVAPRPIRPFRAVLKITAALSAGWPSSAWGLPARSLSGRAGAVLPHT
jgi:hypothetical protein